ncbi:hypothetical protein ml_22 [Mollivirus sibericum]|uniref:hypothetical protein n=1 Tax=Mollivirus sibericum TaxID=1678078 RepID=UPI0006B2D9F4|nr:hypothetical protein ml_22 [Mollivirus sibericum]ALD61824.1 hypothetical protein ml_22 [Mollivirus sibericum]
MCSGATKGLFLPLPVTAGSCWPTGRQTQEGGIPRMSTSTRSTTADRWSRSTRGLGMLGVGTPARFSSLKAAMSSRSKGTSCVLLVSQSVTVLALLG